MAGDLAVATRFYEAIGCEKNEQFSDGNAASMVWSDGARFEAMAPGGPRPAAARASARAGSPP